MKIQFIFLFLLFTAVHAQPEALASPAKTDAAQSPSPRPKAEPINLNLNAETAQKIAEAILVHRFGNAVLAQRPWVVSDHGNSFKIVGTFHRSVNARGGVAEIVIRKSDAQVLSCFHGK